MQPQDFFFPYLKDYSCQQNHAANSSKLSTVEMKNNQYNPFKIKYTRGKIDEEVYSQRKMNEVYFERHFIESVTGKICYNVPLEAFKITNNSPSL